MTTQNARRLETEADRYWREKAAAGRHYGPELAVFAVFMLVMALS